MKEKILKSLHLTQETYDKIEKYKPGYLSLSAWVEQVLIEELEILENKNSEG